MVLLGLAWFARFVVAVATPAAFVAGVLVGSVYLSVLVHLVVTYPTPTNDQPTASASASVGPTRSGGVV